jgi:hypothetical protein
MKMKKYLYGFILAGIVGSFLNATHSFGWHDETHLAIARAAGYKKWYNAAGADMTKIKAGKSEGLNHFVNNPPDTIVTSRMVMKQVKKYNKLDYNGHLYGAILGSLRDYIETTAEGKYAQYHLAFCAHYVGDLSQPLHNALYNDYNREYHQATDGIINDEVLDHPEKIKIYPVVIHSEDDLAGEIAKIAALSLQKANQLEREKRLLSKEEAYTQISHSASLFKAILKYVSEIKGTPP